ncbi:MAG: transporter substrate-binding domain-containing protein, partial [Natronospirillum sp.]
MKTIIYALISTLMLSTYVNAETVTVVADPWPPFIDEEHPEGGVGIQIIREALGRNGYDIEVTIMPWARAEAGVRAGTFDVLPGTWYTEERAEDLLFSDHYMVNEVKFIKRVTDDFQYSGLDSVTGKTVAVILDYGYGDAFYAGDFKRDATTSFASNIQKLIH